MFFRLLLRLTAFVLTGMLIAGGVALAAGRGVSATLLTVSVTTPPAGNLDVFLIDVQRDLQIDMPLPVRGVRDLVLSPNGKRALLISGGALPRLHVYDLQTGDLFSTGTTHDLILDRPPHWSPDSERLAFYESFIPNEANHGIYILDFAAGTVTQVFGSPVQSYWSPDSSRISFTSEGDVYIADSDSTRNVTANELWHYNVQWLTDDTLVFPGLSFDDNRQRLFAIDLDSGSAPVVISGNHTGSTNFPIAVGNSREVVFRLDDALYVADVEANVASSVISLDDPPFPAGTALIDGEWSPDQRYLLAYTAPTDAIPTVHLSTWIRDGATWRELLQESFIRAWSPDSSHVLYTSLNTDTRFYDVMLMDVPVGEVQQLAGQADHIVPSWSADSRYLAYLIRRQSASVGRSGRFSSRIYLVDITGEDGRYLTGVDDYVMHFAFWD